ncbi:MAG: CBS domain-containing protein [Solirubrobacterales bacterium]
MPIATKGAPVLVREGMNPIVVTVGPDHTLREAAKRMTKYRVGAAVVFDNEQPAPGIITERDLLRSNGRGEDIDKELVRDHLADQLIYAYADWPLQKAAEEMTRGGFRHVIVLEQGTPIGILSMRDIVRCWLTEGAGDVTPAPAG